MSQTHGKRRQKEQGPLGIILVVVAGVAMVATLFYVAITRTPPRPTMTQRQSGLPVPPYHKTAEELKSLPATPDPEKFTRPAVVRAYRVAKRIPQVLAQQPCYCGCDRHGHRSLHDCFVTDHAVTCNICLKEALLAGQLHREGKTAREIRDAIQRGEWQSISLL